MNTLERDLWVATLSLGLLVFAAPFVEFDFFLKSFYSVAGCGLSASSAHVLITEVLFGRSTEDNTK